MGIKRNIANIANQILEPMGARLVAYHGDVKPWDEFFERWIAEAEAAGKDPNDLGDVEWSDDPLKQALEEFYLPHVTPESVVLELGPGTGRATRHIIGRCREMVLVDYSTLVCEWLTKYLAGKGRFQVHAIDKPKMPMVESESVDFALANGVFEHVGMDDLAFFIEEFYRVLKPGGFFCFNFDNFMSEGGWEWLRKYRGVAGAQNPFRFYHPEMVAKLAERAGFRVARMKTSESRFAFGELEKRMD